MKNLAILFLTVTTSVFGYASQFDTIKLSIKGNKIIKQNAPQIFAYNLPLKIIIDKSFTSRSIMLKFDESIVVQQTKLEKKHFTNSDKTLDINISKNGIVSSKTFKSQNKFRKFNKIRLYVENINDPFLTPINKTEFKKNNETSSGQNFLINSYQIGYLYYDAIAIKNGDYDTLIKNHYAIKQGGYIDTTYMVNNSNQSKVQSTGSAPTIATNLGNTDVTNLALGTAQFLAERTKEELSVAFFNKMKKQLNAYPELKTVFPNTSAMLNAIESFAYASVLQVLRDAFETDVLNLSTNLYALTELNLMDCAGAEEGKKKNACEARINTLNQFFAQQRVGLWTNVGLYTMREASSSSNPADLLQTVATTSNAINTIKSWSIHDSNHLDKNLVGSIELSNAISQSLISKDSNNVWITKNQMNKLLKDPVLFKIYMGLMLALEHQKDTTSKITFYTSKKNTLYLETLIEKHSDSFAELLQEMHTVLAITNKATTNVKKALEESKAPDAKAFYNYYHALNKSTQVVLKNKLVGLSPKSYYQTKAKLDSFITPAVDLAYHLHSKAYSSAIYNASILLSSISRLTANYHKKKVNYKYKLNQDSLDKQEKELEKIFAGRDSLKEVNIKKWKKDYKNSFQAIKTGKTGKTDSLYNFIDITDTIKAKKNSKLKSFNSSFLKYGTIISTVASAKSSEEIRKAIEASAMPVGSSSIKRNSRWNIALNAYVGGYFGRLANDMKVYSYDSTGLKSDSSIIDKSYGLYAPIGVSFSRRFLKKAGSISIGLQAFDLGALVDFYLMQGGQNANTQVAIPQDFNVKLNNIFAPGAFIGYNIPSTPLTITFGTQLVPALYDRNQIQAEQISTAPSTWRYQAGLTIDIPLLQIKNWD